MNMSNETLLNNTDIDEETSNSSSLSSLPNGTDPLSMTGILPVVVSEEPETNSTATNSNVTDVDETETINMTKNETLSDQDGTLTNTTTTATPPEDDTNATTTTIMDDAMDDVNVTNTNGTTNSANDSDDTTTTTNSTIPPTMEDDLMNMTDVNTTDVNTTDVNMTDVNTTMLDNHNSTTEENNNSTTIPPSLLENEQDQNSTTVSPSPTITPPPLENNDEDYTLPAVDLYEFMLIHPQEVCSDASSKLKVVQEANITECEHYALYGNSENQEKNQGGGTWKGMTTTEHETESGCIAWHAGPDRPWDIYATQPNPKGEQPCPQESEACICVSRDRVDGDLEDDNKGGPPPSPSPTHHHPNNHGHNGGGGHHGNTHNNNPPKHNNDGTNTHHHNAKNGTSLHQPTNQHTPQTNGQESMAPLAMLAIVIVIGLFVLMIVRKRVNRHRYGKQIDQSNDLTFEEEGQFQGGGGGGEYSYNAPSYNNNNRVV